MRDKVHKVMGEFKRGKLHSGTGKKGKKGKKVKSRKQAIAIALSEERRMKGGIGDQADAIENRKFSRRY